MPDGNMNRRTRAEKMTEDDLRNMVRHHIRLSNDYLSGEVAEERTQAYKSYYSEPYGNEIEGRSSFVASDVQDTVESMMPDFMEIFAGSDQPVEFTSKGVKRLPGEPDEQFDARQQQKEDEAGQRTALATHVWNHDNDGFGITYDWVKDALLLKNGFISIQWREDDEIDTHYFENATSLTVQELEAEDGVEITESTPKPVPAGAELYVPDGVLFDIKVERGETRGRVVIENIPPENMLISPRATGFDDQPFIGAKYEKMVSELIEEGFDEELVRALPAHDDVYYERERQARFNREVSSPQLASVSDDLTRKVWIYYTYFHVDWDNDGRAEYREVITAGPDRTILGNEAVDDHPFVDLTPIRMPHKVLGRSIADLVTPIQYIRSTITRSLLDNTYLINNGRALISSRINLDDWTANRPGGAVRVEGGGPVSENFQPIVTQPLAATLLPVMQHFDQEKESRSGQTRYSQGLDANSLNDMAAGINMIIGQAQKRSLLIARLFAETGFKKAFRKIDTLLRAHADRARTIRIHGKYVEVDPRQWTGDMDCTISVGLGHGTTQEKIQMAQARMQVMQKGLEFQGGIEGPFYTPDEVHQHLVDFYNATGKKNAESYVNDPASAPMPQQDQGPSEVEVLAQVEQQKTQMEAQKAAQEDARKREEMALVNEREIKKIMLQHEREMLKIQADGQSTAAMLAAKAEEQTTKAHADAAGKLADVELKERELELQSRKLEQDGITAAATHDLKLAMAEEDSAHKAADREHNANEGRETRQAARKGKRPPSSNK